ncbi:uncharacterized protein EI97DRAFT_435444 [Westerdykella ornata]|uniref:VPS9 domain-containing protein n=1 Tax=Westerdykella ornata TaxID=318751 RepID=A0A6A6JCS6_WESOR|nr:uncharacterized protein EI97DRAFT_435444 [Westerdykella ornata]KAF2274075.1 hypothetical protein EI97DRAFT_435444 [Westerdykella ornata]
MSERPKQLHSAKSFSRLEPTQSKGTRSRNRASTLQGPPVNDILDPLRERISPEDEDHHVEGSVFTTQEHVGEATISEDGVPDSFEELPIEIRSLTERFLESLSAKVHPSPLSADALSELFQDFYSRASAHINTHIATLASRLSRNDAGSPAGRTGKAGDNVGEQQMLTATEVANRKKARRQLEAKRLSIEEAVERMVCERVYDRIYRHRSTDDEERDHKLRSRTAALSLVGIGLRELLMTADDLSEAEKSRTKEREGEIREYLSTARADIQKMDEERYPLGKLRHLTAAHKSIVEALSKIFPATSSADEVLPTLIYTLITSSPESLNVVSNLKFVQRFRGLSRLDGETGYCLVNLEAAVSFLETVDLSSLRAEEAGRTPSRPTTPHAEITPMPLGLSQAPDLTQTPATPVRDAPKRAPSPGSKAQRRLSQLIQTQTNRIEAASDAVRDSIIDSADQALDTINSTLENSLKFLFGKVRERDPNSPGIHDAPILPKTLAEARKLVSSPSGTARAEDDAGSVSAASSVFGDENAFGDGRRDPGSKMADLFGGRRPIRDRSVDSAKSGGSNSSRKPAATTTSNDGKLAPSVPVRPEPQSSNSAGFAVDSLRSMSNSLNPLNRFANMNVLPRFGRATPSASNTPNAASPIIEHNKQLPQASPASRTVSGEVPHVEEKAVRAVAALEALRKTTPPVKKFLEAKDGQELKLKEVDELLKEYQRLAGALRAAINYRNEDKVNM